MLLDVSMEILCKEASPAADMKELEDRICRIFLKEDFPTDTFNASIFPSKLKQVVLKKCNKSKENGMLATILSSPDPDFF
jgi:hypothetical protein